MEMPVTMTLNVAPPHPKSTLLFILKVTLQQAQTHSMNFHQSLNLLLGKHFLAVSINQRDASVFKKVGAEKKYFFS
jgi:hypothetical protein